MELLRDNNKKNSFPIEHDRNIGSKSKAKITAKFHGLSDIDIWKKFKGGDLDAFSHIYFKYYSTLYNYGHQLSSDTEFIEDCIQEVFLDIYKSRDRLSIAKSIKFYLIKSLKSKYLRTLKTYSRAKENEKYSSEYEFQFNFSAEEKIINAQLNEELINKLNKALEALTHRQREVIYYYFYENLSVDEIAEITGVSHRRTIQNIIYRSIALLRDQIDMASLLLFTLITTPH
jgi:RNA polymerase sigma factor (sigma-70 family)